ncbi:MAG: DUF1523 family protein [Pseudomonadota bacterium]
MSNASGIATAIVLGVGVSLSALYNYGTSDNVDITVTRTERVTSGYGEDATSKYMVSTTRDDDGEIEVFRNTDSWLRLKFRSADLQAQLIEGESYNCDVYGWRFGLFSMFRNIVACTSNDNGQVQLYTTSPQQNGLG